jgi:hypothetical protein
MQFYTGYTEEELIPVILHLSNAHHALLSSKYQSIINKFDTKSHHHCCSSVLAIPLAQLRYDRQQSPRSTEMTPSSPMQQLKTKNITPQKPLKTLPTRVMSRR